MLVRLAIACLVCAAAAMAEAPEGFQPLFNGRNIAGWHISMTNHHGDTSEWRVIDGALTGTQKPENNGGILLTDESYGDFELYLEIMPDFGCDGGVFLRSTEAGQAYQVMLDYLPGGNVGGIHGERLPEIRHADSEGWQEVWKKDAWNEMRIRIEGAKPHIQVWLNGTRITDYQDSENHAVNEATEGPVAVQVHGGKRCKPGAYQRFQTIAVKPL